MGRAARVRGRFSGSAIATTTSVVGQTKVEDAQGGVRWGARRRAGKPADDVCSQSGVPVRQVTWNGGWQRQHLCCPWCYQAMRLRRVALWRAALVCAPSVQFAACVGGDEDGGGAGRAVGRAARVAEQGLGGRAALSPGMAECCRVLPLFDRTTP